MWKGGRGECGVCDKDLFFKGGGGGGGGGGAGGLGDEGWVQGRVTVE